VSSRLASLSFFTSAHLREGEIIGGNEALTASLAETQNGTYGRDISASSLIHEVPNADDGALGVVDRHSSYPHWQENGKAKTEPDRT
jgi:hypothetical protein